MTFDKHTPHDGPGAGPDRAVATAAIDRAIAGGDLERAALLLLIEAVRTLEAGTIDDLIDELAGEASEGARDDR